MKGGPEIIKLLEESISSNFDITLVVNYSDLTPNPKATETIIKKWNYFKIKSFWAEPGWRRE